ncbi:MAG: YigZ family protein [Edaphocola sp.]
MYTYRTVGNQPSAEFKDRGSKFIAYAYPIRHADDVKPLLQLLKKEHNKAVHHCYAYRLGTDKLQFRANDDGEPAGSAGKPILGQIDSAGLTNILVVVARYFGGTLLGIPGLINAYKTATNEALRQAKIVEKNIEILATLSYDYSLMNEVMQALKKFEATIHHQEMSLFCRVSIGIPLAQQASCMKTLTDIRGLEIKTTDAASHK